MVRGEQHALYYYGFHFTNDEDESIPRLHYFRFWQILNLYGIMFSKNTIMTPW